MVQAEGRARTKLPRPPPGAPMLSTLVASEPLLELTTYPVEGLLRGDELRPGIAISIWHVGS
jgi:hypothetical protein